MNLANSVAMNVSESVKCAKAPDFVATYYVVNPGFGLKCLDLIVPLTL